MEIINTTPHSVRFVAADGNVFEVPACGVLINAAFEEQPAPRHPSGAALVYTSFATIPRDDAALRRLEEKHPDAVIVGSVIAAQAYPGRVVSMLAAPGYERAPVEKKLMRSDKFVVFRAS